MSKPVQLYQDAERVKKDRALYIRVSEDERKWIKQLAALAGMTDTSSLIRAALDHYFICLPKK